MIYECALVTLCSLFKAMISLSVSINSSLDIKDISKMIFHLKFIFAWILLIPQLTGNVFNRDCDRIF